MVKIIRKILNPNLSNVPNRSMTPKYITVHNTANPSRGAGAELHSRYQHNGSGGRKVSWGYSVDDKVIYQTLEDNQQGYHAGTSKGNAESIGIEICENSDSDFEIAVDNAQELIKQLMEKHNIPINRVVTHKYWSGKNCPHLLLARWDKFIDGVEAKTGNVSTIKPKPNKKPVSVPKQPLKSGDKVVRKIQAKLNRYHGINIKEDGYKGPLTYSALVNAYQQELRVQFGANIVADGKPGRRTDAVAVNMRYSKTKGDLAFLVQAMLYLHGINVSVDGFFQDGSINAVKQFQRKHGLKADGIAGASTFKKLIRF